ncbi:MAG: right-handed parallel beta-helix repeat-containing protein [Clostridia bacterium]|nr:right-handed parallel beta-helix repeat-containing protein [Clostridia bacterium]
MIYYVSTCGNDCFDGTVDAPFRTINHAAQVAVAGDTVRVYGGTYREWVDPKNSGTEHAHITYEAMTGETPVIKGSEIITDWERIEGTVWKKILPNSMFGDFNPYAEKVSGDWLIDPVDEGLAVHLGDVYINGTSMFEAYSLEGVKKAERRERGYSFRCDNLSTDEKIGNPEDTVYQWYAEVSEQETALFCNFGKFNPNEELIEINVRPCCFFPKQTGIDYITVRGFEIAQGATQWAPPTAEQIGLIGPHWSKGWLIENNHIHHAKCSAVSLGKEISTGHNLHSLLDKKSGYQYQMESVFKALLADWNRESVGSHTVRNNIIHDCGQTGIVGHLGCVFSKIEHNHIYNIARKQEFWGHEIAGIKLHAPIDVVIDNNNIHDCALGIWLDWEVQGTRITKNLFYNNGRDLMIEVTHGPCTVDHNMLLSKYALEYAAQGTAFVHNLMCGVVYHYPVLDRATPYHNPHTTQIAGYAFVYGGDDRILNNIVVGHEKLSNKTLGYFGDCMDAYTNGMDAYLEQTRAISVTKDHQKYFEISQPVWCEGNAYAGITKPYRFESCYADAKGFEASIEEKDCAWILTLNTPMSVVNASMEPVTTERLGAPRITEERFENPDGTPIDFSVDYHGLQRGANVIPGPFAKLSAGKTQLTVWE